MSNWHWLRERKPPLNKKVIVFRQSNDKYYIGEYRSESIEESQGEKTDDFWILGSTCHNLDEEEDYWMEFTHFSPQLIKAASESGVSFLKST